MTNPVATLSALFSPSTDPAIGVALESFSAEELTAFAETLSQWQNAQTNASSTADPSAAPASAVWQPAELEAALAEILEAEVGKISSPQDLRLTESSAGTDDVLAQSLAPQPQAGEKSQLQQPRSSNTSDKQPAERAPSALPSELALGAQSASPAAEERSATAIRADILQALLNRNGAEVETLTAQATESSSQSTVAELMEASGLGATAAVRSGQMQAMTTPPEAMQHGSLLEKAAKTTQLTTAAARTPDGIKTEALPQTVALENTQSAVMREALGKTSEVQDDQLRIVTPQIGLRAQERTMQATQARTPALEALAANTTPRSSEGLSAQTAGGNAVFAASQNSNSAVPPAAALHAQPMRFEVPTAQNHPAWGQVVSHRVVWMAKHGIQQAMLQLNPAQLGPVEVRIQMHNDQATVHFMAMHAQTREALELALPRLREGFAENGVALADAQVSDQGAQQAGDQATGGSASQILAMDSDAVADESQAAEGHIPDPEQGLGISLYA